MEGRSEAGVIGFLPSKKLPRAGALRSGGRVEVPSRTGLDPVLGLDVVGTKTCEAGLGVKVALGFQRGTDPVGLCMPLDAAEGPVGGARESWFGTG
jgi:hypothetical protein